LCVFIFRVFSFVSLFDPLASVPTAYSLPSHAEEDFTRAGQQLDSQKSSIREYPPAFIELCCRVSAAQEYEHIQGHIVAGTLAAGRV
jgi:hypothetical protein